VKVTKTVSLVARQGSSLEIVYSLENLPVGLPIHFGVEFNFAAMPAGAGDRYYYDAEGQNLGPLQSQCETAEASRIGLVDEWLGLDVSLDVSQPAKFWTQTDSNGQSVGKRFRAGSSKLLGDAAVAVPRARRWQVDGYSGAVAGHIGGTGARTFRTIQRQIGSVDAVSSRGQFSSTNNHNDD